MPPRPGQQQASPIPAKVSFAYFSPQSFLIDYTVFAVVVLLLSYYPLHTYLHTEIVCEPSPCYSSEGNNSYQNSILIIIITIMKRRISKQWLIVSIYNICFRLPNHSFLQDLLPLLALLLLPCRMDLHLNRPPLPLFLAEDLFQIIIVQTI